MRAFALVFILLLIPTALFAATGDFEPLVDLPGVGYEDGEGSLSDYINAIFNIVIAFAAMIAVLRVIMGGFQYMTTEAVTTKGEARSTIQNAIFGLILLGGSWLILNTINPQILNLSALNFSTLQPEGAAEEQLRERARTLQELVERDDGPFFNKDDARDFVTECRRLGGSSSDITTTFRGCIEFRESRQQGQIIRTCVREEDNGPLVRYIATCSGE